MDDGRARVMSVMRIQRAHQARVRATFELCTRSRPREASFLLLTFLWTRKEKYVSTDKKFFHAQSKERIAKTSADLRPFA